MTKERMVVACTCLLLDIAEIQHGPRAMACAVEFLDRAAGIVQTPFSIAEPFRRGRHVEGVPSGDGPLRPFRRIAGG